MWPFFAQRKRKRRKPPARRPPPHTIPQILAWADQHKKRTGRWPIATSGSVAGTLRENWQAIDAALRVGHRGLAGGSSLAQLLAEHRGVRNIKALPPPMKKILIGIRIDEKLMNRLLNAIWHLGHGLSVGSITNEAVERELKKLEKLNGGKPFARRRGELPKSNVKREKKSG